MSNASKRILVAEDNPALLAVIRFNLERAGFSVTAVANGQDALSELKKSGYDAVLTDLQMPRMTGVELSEQMCADEKLHGLPIVMLTAKGMEVETDKLCGQLGVTAVLAKPFSPIELVKTIEACLAAPAAKA